MSLARFGVDTKAKDRGLKTLEEAGLVEVRRRAGKNPVVSLVLGQIDPPQKS